MEITKTVPVTIVVHPKFPTLCSGACPNYGRIKEIGTSYFNSDLGFCHRYQTKQAELYVRCPECLAEFGTGEVQPTGERVLPVENTEEPINTCVEYRVRHGGLMGDSCVISEY